MSIRSRFSAAVLVTAAVFATAGSARAQVSATAATSSTTPPAAPTAGPTAALAPLTSVTGLELQRYIGQWYEVARYPNKFQSQCVGNVTAAYRMRDDGDIDVVNRCRRANGNFDQSDGRARLARRAGEATTNSRLEVRFAPAWLGWLPFVWGNYWVIDLAPDYTWSVVSEPNREYLWILSRSPILPPETYEMITQRLSEKGFDIKRLARTPQTGS